MTPIRDEAALARILEGRRILLTGHTGFKGGWLALWLRHLGARVTGIALAPGTPSFCDAVGLPGLIDHRIGDIRGEESFGQAVGGDDFDLVIHMAAQAIVRASYESPVDTYLTNVVGTAVVLDAARRMPSLKGIVVVTSDKCYDNREWVWGYRENDPMGGRDPYSSSKGAAELVAAAYRSSYFSKPGGPRLASVRAGNVFGGGDWGADRLVPDMIRSVDSGEPARIRNPHSVRPWQHVFEPLRGYLMVAAELLAGDEAAACGWNFGPDPDATVEVGRLADMVVARWPDRGPRYRVEPVPGAPKEAVLLRLDSTKAAVELGWRPLLGIRDAVDLSVDWYRAFREEPGAIRSFSEAQLAHYAALWAASDHKG